MARPVVGETTEELYEILGALAAGDEERDWPLLRFVEAICSALLERIHVYVGDREELPGWVVVLDPDNSPLEALDYLAQFVGVTLEPALSEAERREKIKLPEGFRRGTPAAMRAAIERELTGSKTILITERFEDSAYKLWIRTLASETPSEDRVMAAILSQKPIGIVLTYEAIVGQSWADLQLSATDWDDVAATYDDWDDVRTTLP